MAEFFDETITYIIEKYQGIIYYTAFTNVKDKHDTDDVFHGIFMIYLKNKTFFDEGHRKAWLIRTTPNCCKRVLHNNWRIRKTL